MKASISHLKGQKICFQRETHLPHENFERLKKIESQEIGKKNNMSQNVGKTKKAQKRSIVQILRSNKTFFLFVK